MGTVKQDTVEFKFVGESVRKSFKSTEEALAYVNKKNLLPANGKSWEIEEVHTKVISYTFESERKVVENTEITKKVIDYFLKHATVFDVEFADNPQFFIDPDNRDFAIHSQLYAYLCCKHYLGWNREQFDEQYNKYVEQYKKCRCINSYACQLICFYAIKDKFNIDEKDLYIDFDKDGDPLYYCNDTLKNNKKAINEVKHWLNDMYFADGPYFDPYEYAGIHEQPMIWRHLSPNELLAAYKEVLSKLPVEKMKWSYNSGNYAPCNNYKLEVVDFEEIRKSPELKNSDRIHMWGAFIPGIMFRDGDIMITDDNYYGRNVSLIKSKVCDVDEKLYEYCIKNLKK